MSKTRHLYSCCSVFVLLAAIGTTAESAAVRPYGLDADTLHLYHFNGDGSDAAMTNPYLLVMEGAATATTDSLSQPFGTALATNRRIDASGVNNTAGAMHAPAQEDTPFGNLTGPTGAFTFEAYVRSDCPLASQNGMIMTAENEGGAPTARAFQMRIIAGNFNFVQINPLTVTNSAAVPTTGTHAYVPGAWYHVAATYTGVPGAADNLKLYWTAINSGANEPNLLKSFTMVDSIPPTTTVDFMVGNIGRASGSNLGGVNAFFGVIDEVRISKVARTPTQMMTSETVTSTRNWQLLQ